MKVLFHILYIISNLIIINFMGFSLKKKKLNYYTQLWVCQNIIEQNDLFIKIKNI